MSKAIIEQEKLSEQEGTKASKSELKQASYSRKKN